MAKASGLRGNRDFQRYWAGQAISIFGSQISLLAYPLLVLSLGGSAAQAGMVASGSLLTRTVCRLPAGHLVDRLDRRWLMLWTDLVRFAAVGSIPVLAATGLLSYPQLLVVALVEGVASALFGPASTVAARDVVPKEHLAEALGRSQTSASVAGLAGPLLGGWLFSVDRVLPFLCDSASYAVSAVLIFRITIRSRPKPTAGQADRRLTAGIRWLGRQPVLLRALLFAGAVNLVGAAIDVAIVVALHAQGESSATVGVVLACAGVGAVIGAVLATRIVRRLAPGTILVGVGVLGTTCLTAFAFTSSSWVMGGLLTVFFLLSPPAGIVVGQALMLMIPHELLGRVSTAAGTLMAGMAAFGPGLAGLLQQAIGVSHTWLALALLTGAATLLGAFPLLREQGLVPAPTPDVEREPAV
ncbi:MFS transporter [Kitasatospora sp. MAP5-34]|uniref:MFS transporter n=1 Tax=Kitasatospora sp. MAP5-34 TaxID=3035102 RepID=UPI00247367FD|nr:MFS transporter [Kitasatospora sp. MAP5-34]MDH6579917.1 MFS family permease [Kitasatospora sp. MAP5-34]